MCLLSLYKEIQFNEHVYESIRAASDDKMKFDKKFQKCA